MSSSEYVLQLPDGGGPIPISLLDAAAADKLRALLEGSDAVEVRLTSADDDTAGHDMASGAVVVQASFGDDVEGHAFSLRFANPAAAADFQKRLIATGAIVATLAASAVGAGLVAQSLPDNPAIDAGPGTMVVDRPADWDAAHHMGAVSNTQQAPGIYYSASSAGSGIREDVKASEPQAAPGIYYSASSAESGIREDVKASEPQAAPGIYYSASSAQAGVDVEVVDGQIQVGGGAAAVDEIRDAGLSTGSGAPSAIEQYPDHPLSPGTGDEDDTLPNQSNLRGTDKSLPGV